MNITNKGLKLLGLLLIIIGVGYLGDQIYFWDFTIFFDGWWACILVILGLCSMVEDGINIWNSLLIAFGVYCFLDANDLIHFDITLLMVFAIAMIIAGVKLLFFSGNKVEMDPTISNSEKVVSETANADLNSNARRIYVNSSFNTRNIKEQGIIDKCRIENLFGNVYLDLSECDLRTLDVMSVDTVFGNVEIVVPSDVNLKMVKGKTLSGSYIDTSFNENGYDVLVRGSRIFGTIRITKAYS